MHSSALEPRAGGVSVEFDAVSFHYDTPEGPLSVLDNVGFALAPGASVAITGTSGSGKTTLLAIMGGLDRPSSGTVRVDGDDVGRLSRDELAEYRRATVGFVFQDFGLLGQLTALENVELAMTLDRQARRQRRARARDLLDAVGLSARASHRPRALSGGEKQRVAIARSLANNPRLVLADEPTGNLDAASTGPVLDLLMRATHEHGCTVVVVTHDPAVAVRAAHTLHLVDGHIHTVRANS